jgi:hypothetical protein
MSATVVLIGSGAIRSSWAPVLRAIAAARGTPPPRGEPCLSFVQLTWKLRWLKSQLMCGHVKVGRQRRIRSTYLKTCREYRALQTSIAKELKAAAISGEIAPDPEARGLRAWLSTQEAFVITTNWDRTIETVLPSRPRPLYLHGNADRPRTLFLPSETIEEPYRLDTGGSRPHGDRAGAAMSILEKCSRVVVYGLSVSPFDVELGMVLGSAFGTAPSTQEILVVNPEPEPVISRLQFFLPKARVREASAELWAGRA